MSYERIGRGQAYGMTETNSVAVSVSAYSIRSALRAHTLLVIQSSQEKTTLQGLLARQSDPTVITHCLLKIRPISGRPSPVNEVKIMSEDRCAPPGNVGEVCL